MDCLSSLGFFGLLLQDHIDSKEKMDAELASLKAEIEALKTDHDHKLMYVHLCGGTTLAAGDLVVISIVESPLHKFET